MKTATLERAEKLARMLADEVKKLDRSEDSDDETPALDFSNRDQYGQGFVYACGDRE